MDQPAQQTADVPVPSAGRVVAGALPGAVVAVLGIPLLAWWLMDDAGDARVRWWPVPVIALVGLIALLGHYARATPPEGRTRTERKHMERALSAIPRKGPVPDDPLVRRAVVVSACNNIAALVFWGAVLLGMALGAGVRPGYSWFAASGGAVGLAAAAAVQLRRHWANYQALHPHAHALAVDGGVRQVDAVPVPTVGRVLAHSVPAVLLLAAGVPLVVQWTLEGHGDALGNWSHLPLILLITVASVLHALVRAPRPRLGVDVDRGAMQRWLLFAAVSRRLPENPRARITAGAFACQQLEAAALMLAGVAGLIITAIIRSSPWWAIVGALIVLIWTLQVIRARRGWIYLQLLHTADDTW
ncbi:hypothetical protein [Kocuria turfanensis]|uniref:Uncharacterized protein n=1 Tax=Kocuria turfanensis TaxID=388357 RepID=A0A512IH70_9MICC|nr:hypothetical protein [Kocuria turfanensis]GEO97041.1 hypothetical protein KTU01_31640 [Kocuria turfanensis]